LRTAIERQLESECSGIKKELDTLFGKHRCLWKNRVVVSDHLAPHVNGAKSFQCYITIRKGRALSPQRWRTLIHEMIHAYSPGMTSWAYDKFPGWEEGVVEKLQRLLRDRIFKALNEVLDETQMVQMEQEEQDHVYNDYINAIEIIRKLSMRSDVEEFYIELLLTPLKDRLWLTEKTIKAIRGEEGHEFFQLACEVLRSKVAELEA
jgi:hypothetical protein